MAEVFFDRRAFAQPVRKATARQVHLICELYEELGQDYFLHEIEDLSVSEASDAISELLSMKHDF